MLSRVKIAAFNEKVIGGLSIRFSGIMVLSILLPNKKFIFVVWTIKFKNQSHLFITCDWAIQN